MAQDPCKQPFLAYYIIPYFIALFGCLVKNWSWHVQKGLTALVSSSYAGLRSFFFPLIWQFSLQSTEILLI